MSFLKVGVPAVIVVLLALAAGLLYCYRANPVLYRAAESGSVDPEPFLVIFNPLRDRGPERDTEAFLELLRGGKCAQAAAALDGDGAERQEICSLEAERPLRSWRLANRHDQPGRVKVFYRVNRDEHEDYLGNLWVTLERRGQAWQVTGYECWY